MVTVIFSVPKYVEDAKEDILMKVNEKRDETLKFPTFESYCSEIIRNHVATIMKAIRMYESSGKVMGKKMDLKRKEIKDPKLGYHKSEESDIEINVGNLQIEYMKNVISFDHAIQDSEKIPTAKEDRINGVAELCRNIVNTSSLGVLEEIDKEKMKEEAKVLNSPPDKKKKEEKKNETI